MKEIAQPRSLYRKLVDSHTVETLDEQNILLYVDLHLMNEYTSPQAFAGLDAAQRPVAVPGAQVAVVDHIIPTHPVAHRVIQDPASALQASNLRRNCEKHEITLYDTNDSLQGIEHIIAPELGMIRPGMVVLCGDSHTTTYGALGALGFGIGTSEIEHILATQTLVYRVENEMRICVSGRLPYGTSAKDLILHVIGEIGAQGARGYAVEFCGEAIRSLSIEARMTLCNMAVEAGARAALIAPDSKTLDYVLDRACDIDDSIRDSAILAWQSLFSDDDAVFVQDLYFDASAVEPQVTWGTSPDQTIGVTQQTPLPAAFGGSARQSAAQRAYEYMGLVPGISLIGVPVDRVFIGSCTNARIEDLRHVAQLVRGKNVAAGVRAMVVPGSGLVRLQAEAEGIAEILKDAGFEWRQPGCSMCLAMNDDVLRPGERCASTTNRNFEGRQGRAGRTHLMSPIMAAAAALEGKIVDVRTLNTERSGYAINA